jgi:hypothetical protein
MARKLKSTFNPYWLVSGGEKDGIQVASYFHDDRYLEIQVLNCDARFNPWTITVTDLIDGRSITLRGDGQKKLTALALEQVKEPIFCRHNRLDATCPICSRKVNQEAA